MCSSKPTHLRTRRAICVRRAVRSYFSDLRIATWNVEGLTDEKAIILTRIMFRCQIDVLCITETLSKSVSNTFLMMAISLSYLAILVTRLFI